MAGEVRHEPHRRRRIDPRRTFSARVERMFLMPHLPRHVRNQRLTIVVLVLLLGIYLLIRPAFDDVDAPAGPAATPSKGLAKPR